MRQILGNVTYHRSFSSFVVSNAIKQSLASPLVNSSEQYDFHTAMNFATVRRHHEAICEPRVAFNSRRTAIPLIIQVCVRKYYPSAPSIRRFVRITNSVMLLL